jgi:S-layer homology domain.
MIKIPRKRVFLNVFLVFSVLFCGMSFAGTSFAAVTTENLNSKDNSAYLSENEIHYAYIAGFPDGSIRPVNKLTREEAAVILYRLLPEELRSKYQAGILPFRDIAKQRWSAKQIAVLYEAGIVNGYPDGSFRPERPITRAEFAAMAGEFTAVKEKMIGPDAETEGQSSKQEGRPSEQDVKLPELRIQFPDTDNHWAAKYAADSVAEGWIRKFGDGTFRPEGSIIRCEAMMLVNDVLNRRVNQEGLVSNMRQWQDNPRDKWYYEIVLEAADSHYCLHRENPKSTEKWTGLAADPVL